MRLQYQSDLTGGNRGNGGGNESLCSLRFLLFNCRITALATALLFSSASSTLAEVHYVDLNCTNATPPYTNGATAATSIQAAVDAAVAGDEIVVTNGFYDPVTVNKPLTVRSVNGPQVTTIDGGEACRCVSLAGNASLSGFTLTHGVSAGGGGAYGGTLNNCTLTGNSAFADGSQGFYSLGGGAAYCTLNNCTLSGNSAIARNYVHAANEPVAWGGGAFGCTLNNCVLSGNSASASSDFTVSGASGGGANNCELNNCTVTGNSASATSGNLSPGTWAGGAGAYASTLHNCISFGNQHYTYDPGNRTCEDCGGNPGFVDTNGWSNLRLQSNSPYINAGNNAYAPAGPDLDGDPRISGGTVDIGAYEFQWPQLAITSSAANVVLTWPTNNAGYDYTGFTLQSTTNLVSPVVWTTNSPAPIVIGGQNTVTNPIVGPQQFYRLSH